MKVRALNPATDDWTFGKGLNDYYVKNDAVAQAISTRLQSFLGDCFFDAAAGLDWFTILGSKDVLGAKLKIAAVILNTPGVTGIRELSATLDRDRRLTLVYSVSTIYPGGIVRKRLVFLTTEDDFILDTEDGAHIAT